MSVPPIDLWCDECWEEIWRQRRAQKRFLLDTAIEVFSLWDWSQGGYDIEALIKQRKSPMFDEAHQRLAQYFFNEWSGSLRVPSAIVYPSKIPGVRDHTASLAEAFAKLLRTPAWPIKISSDAAYKTRSQRERLRHRRALSEKKKDVAKSSPLLFVDDVFTTGATAGAVWAALGRPENFQVAVLAYKTLNFQRVGSFYRPEEKNSRKFEEIGNI